MNHRLWVDNHLGIYDITLLAPRGGWFNFHVFFSDCNHKKYIDALFFLLFQFSSRCTLVILVPNLWSYPSWVPSYGLSKLEHVKMQILGKYKMAATGHTVGLRKKFKKQKSSVWMSYPWNGAKFFSPEQNLRSYGRKTDFHIFGWWTLTEKILNLKMAATKLQEIFQHFFPYHLKVYVLGHTW